MALPLQLMVAAPLKAPSAVPTTLRSFAHDALNEPLALVPVCSVTFHLKSVQELGAGIRFDEVQVPIRELLPAAVGPASELVRSKPTQPAAETAATDSTAVRIRFFMFYISVAGRANFARAVIAGRKKYTNGKVLCLQSFTDEVSGGGFQIGTPRSKP